jgi:hypothetical protein
MEVEQGVRETDRDRRMEIAGGGPRSLTYTATLLAPRQQAAGAVINGPRTVTGGRRQRRELPRPERVNHGVLVGTAKH